MKQYCDSNCGTFHPKRNGTPVTTTKNWSLKTFSVRTTSKCNGLRVRVFIVHRDIFIQNTWTFQTKWKQIKTHFVRHHRFHGAIKLLIEFNEIRKTNWKTWTPVIYGDWKLDFSPLFSNVLEQQFHENLF